jgi:hypothetical protein
MIRRGVAVVCHAVRDRSTERRAHRALSSLGTLPETWTTAELLDIVARHRGRPIEVSYVDPDLLVGGPCGMLLVTKDVDHLLVAAHGPTEHQDHVVLHEVAHMLLHHTCKPSSPQFLRTLMPTLDPGAVLQVLCRTTFDTDDERAAELLATMLYWRGTRPLRERMNATFLG